MVAMFIFGSRMEMNADVQTLGEALGGLGALYSDPTFHPH